MIINSENRGSISKRKGSISKIKGVDFKNQRGRFQKSYKNYEHIYKKKIKNNQKGSIWSILKNVKIKGVDFTFQLYPHHFVKIQIRDL